MAATVTIVDTSFSEFGTAYSRAYSPAHDYPAGHTPGLAGHNFAGGALAAPPAFLGRD
jgi:hypothetical protein